MSRPDRRLLVLVYASALAQGLTVVSVPASASALKHVLDDAQYGAIFVPQMLATLAGSLLSSRLGPRAAGGGALGSALACSALAQALLASVPFGGGFGCALGATFALGLGFGASAAALNAWPGQLLPRHAQSALVALHTVLAAGFACGPLLVPRGEGWLALPLAIGALDLLLALAVFVCCPAVLPASRAPLATAGSARSAVQPAVGGSRAGLFFAIAVLYALAEGTFANWALVFLHEERGLAERSAGLSLSTFWGALACGRLLASALLVRVPARAIWLGLPVCMALAFVSLPLVDDARGAVLAFGFAGLSCSAFFPLTVSLASASFDGGAARASALLTAALMIGVGLGSWAIGPLRASATLAAIYRGSTVYPLLALGLCSLLTWRGRGLPEAASAAPQS